MVRPSPAAVFGAAVGAGLSVSAVCTGIVPSRAVGSRSTNARVGGLAAIAPREVKPSTRQPAPVRMPSLRRSRRLKPALITSCRLSNALSARFLGPYFSRRMDASSHVAKRRAALRSVGEVGWLRVRAVDGRGGLGSGQVTLAPDEAVLQSTHRSSFNSQCRAVMQRGPVGAALKRAGEEALSSDFFVFPATITCRAWYPFCRSVATNVARIFTLSFVYSQPRPRIFVVVRNATKRYRSIVRGFLASGHKQFIVMCFQGKAAARAPVDKIAVGSDCFARRALFDRGAKSWWWVVLDGCARFAAQRTGCDIERGGAA